MICFICIIYNIETNLVRSDLLLIKINYGKFYVVKLYTISINIYFMFFVRFLSTFLLEFDDKDGFRLLEF